MSQNISLNMENMKEGSNIIGLGKPSEDSKIILNIELLKDSFDALKSYKKEEENYNNHFIGYMLMHPQDIKSYTCVNYDTGEKTVCSSYEEFYDNLMKNK